MQRRMATSLHEVQLPAAAAHRPRLGEQRRGVLSALPTELLPGTVPARTNAKPAWWAPKLLGANVAVEGARRSVRFALLT